MTRSMVSPFQANSSRRGKPWEMMGLEEALGMLYHRAKQPRINHIICIMQKCRKAKTLLHARSLHAQICNYGLEAHMTLGNYMVPVFVECGSISDAQHAFNKLIFRNEHPWTSLISGYVQSGHPQHALSLYQKMQEESVQPSGHTFMALLKACAKLKDSHRGRQIHIEINEHGFDSDIFVANSLIDMYAKCGLLSEGQDIFDKLPVRNVVSWNALIAGYAENGSGEEALKRFEDMHLKDIPPSAVTFVCVLKACGSLRLIDKGRQIHKKIAQTGFERDLYIANSLIDMYCKCGSIPEAQAVFDKLPVRDIVSWNALITGYSDYGLSDKAVKCYDHMQVEGISPDPITFVQILKVCGSIGALAKGREIHIAIAQKGLEKDVFIGNVLVNMYVKCGSLAEAQEVFEKLPNHDIVLWTTLIAGYVELGDPDKALACFEDMELEGVSSDAVTFVYIMKACGSIGAIEKGRRIHAEIIEKGFEREICVGGSLVDMYAKCGSLSEAQEVFNKLPGRDVVSWTALIAGYAEHGPAHKALICLEQMQLEGVFPNVITFMCCLKACANLGAIDKGREIHAKIKAKGFEGEICLGGSLVDMYAKCCSLSEAQEVFNKLQVRDVALWSAMINAYGMNYEGNMAVQCFEDMQEHVLKPNAVTFTCLLTACSRSGLVSKGQHYFKAMQKRYGIIPVTDHYTSIIDLLARSGNFYEAEKFLESMPCCPSIETWTALLSACKTYGEVELGLRCFQELVQVKPENAASYILMKNTYECAGRKDDAHKIEGQRKLAGARKKPACALIEVNKEVHVFVVGDKQSQEISAMIEILNSGIKEEGHAPNLDPVLRPLSDEEKEITLCEHAEKVALAFGLLNTPSGQTLRAIKNMRMCNNCHAANKTIARIEKREIVVRDSYCVHHFKEGLCSCGS